MWIHADDAIDQINWLMALESLWKEEIDRMFPRKYYPSEISLMVSSWEYSLSDFKNWIFINN